MPSPMRTRAMRAGESVVIRYPTARSDERAVSFSGEQSMVLSAAISERQSPPPTEKLELAPLFDVSQVLPGSGSLREALSSGLRILAHYHGVPRSSVTLVDEGSDELYIEASFGLDATGQQTRYRLGEGITGRVAASGKAIVVPDV